MVSYIFLGFYLCVFHTLAFTCFPLFPKFCELSYSFGSSVLQRHKVISSSNLTQQSLIRVRWCWKRHLPRHSDSLHNIQVPAKFTTCNGIRGKTSDAAGQGGQSETQRNSRRRINSPPWPRRQVSNMRNKEYGLPHTVKANTKPIYMKFSCDATHRNEFVLSLRCNTFVFSGSSVGVAGQSVEIVIKEKLLNLKS